MRKWLAAIVLACIAAGVCLYVFARSRHVTPVNQGSLSAISSDTKDSAFQTKPSIHSTSIATTTNVSVSATVANYSAPTISSKEPPHPSVVLPEPEGELPQLPASTVLENVRIAFRQYSSKFGGNPVGTNPEITRALNGENPRQIRFLHMEDGMRLNNKGELVDAWGTPYFFHQLSGFEMEIHSAGPDRKMWTTDDLVIK